jgi:hypothetical protein
LLSNQLLNEKSIYMSFCIRQDSNSTIFAPLIQK